MRSLEPAFHNSGVGMEKKEFQMVLQLMRGNERIQKKDIFILLLDFAIKHYADHGDSLYIARLIQATPASRRKEVCLLARERIRHAAEANGSKRTMLLKPVSILTKFQREAERIEHEEADRAFRLIGLDIQAQQDEIEYEALQKAISEIDTRDRAVLRKDRSMLSTTFSKANQKTFVQGGAPGLVQQRR